MEVEGCEYDEDCKDTYVNSDVLEVDALETKLTGSSEELGDTTTAVVGVKPRLVTGLAGDDVAVVPPVLTNMGFENLLTGGEYVLLGACEVDAAAPAVPEGALPRAM